VGTLALHRLALVPGLWLLARGARRPALAKCIARTRRHERGPRKLVLGVQCAQAEILQKKSQLYLLYKWHCMPSFQNGGSVQHSDVGTDFAAGTPLAFLLFSLMFFLFPPSNFAQRRLHRFNLRHAIDFLFSFLLTCPPCEFGTATTGRIQPLAHPRRRAARYAIVYLFCSLIGLFLGPP